MLTHIERIKQSGKKTEIVFYSSSKNNTNENPMGFQKKFFKVPG